MFTIKRSPFNPILTPSLDDPWESKAVFNWCPVQDGKITHYVYRAMSSNEVYFGSNISVSSIGYTSSKDGINFTETKQFIAPEYDWERYGCEDPRVTKFDGKFYIFYTALSNYPFTADGIKIAVAVTKDFKKIEEKHLVTPFNAKAMALFPEKINGKITVILSVNTDLNAGKNARMCIAQLNKIEDLWNEKYWTEWYKNLDSNTIDPRRTKFDHIEVGAVPVKTKKGWVLIYSHIENYFKENNPFVKVFGIEALLLDAKDPRKIKAHTNGPMFAPSEVYEELGDVPDIIFPSGALLRGNELEIYYGAADTVCCMASVRMDDLLEGIRSDAVSVYFTRYERNPILSPRAGYSWEARGVLNPAAIRLGNTTYILYRAMSDDDTSTIGYASTKDGFNIIDRSEKPIYVPRESFETKIHPGNSGCEDPRLSLIGEKIYMTYTAYNGVNPPRVAITSITVKDFIKKNWDWTTPILISPEGEDDKDSCLLPEKVNGKYLLFHRIRHKICADYIESLDFKDGPLKLGTPIILPRKGMWDSEKVGVNTVDIKTDKGWIAIYHGISANHHTYRVGAALLDLKNPTHVIARVSQPIFQPEARYEKEGLIPNVVFPCGTAIIKDKLFLYYGGADSVVGVATIPLKKLINSLT